MLGVMSGVMRDINAVLAGSNVAAQHLGTLGGIGYMVADLDAQTETEVHRNLVAIEHNTRVRVLRQGSGYQGDAIKM